MSNETYVAMWVPLLSFLESTGIVGRGLHTFFTLLLVTPYSFPEVKFLLPASATTKETVKFIYQFLTDIVTITV